MKKKLTVIVPVYNEQELIGGCLDSLNHQSLDRNDYEVIVIDNNSTDLSAKIAHEKHVRVEHEPQKGYVHAIKKGFDISTTEFVAFTDADCRVPENWAKKILDHFASSEKIVGVGGKVEFYDLPLIFDKSIQLILYINNALPGRLWPNWEASIQELTWVWTTG
jgi:glycosyltransferase involved in cell wall biosynthesis